jgi:hypothetical protein
MVRAANRRGERDPRRGGVAALQPLRVRKALGSSYFPICVQAGNPDAASARFAALFVQSEAKVPASFTRPDRWPTAGSTRSSRRRCKVRPSATRAQPAMRAVVRSVVGAGALHDVHHRPVPLARFSKSGIRPQLGRRQLAHGDRRGAPTSSVLRSNCATCSAYCHTRLETGTSSSLRATGTSHALGSIAGSSIARSDGCRSPERPLPMMLPSDTLAAPSHPCRRRGRRITLPSEDGARAALTAQARRSPRRLLHRAESQQASSAARPSARSGRSTPCRGLRCRRPLHRRAASRRPSRSP